MKRDLEAVLAVLSAIEASPDAIGVDAYDLAEFCLGTCAQGDMQSAQRLLIDSNYIIGEKFIRLTWAGHSLLEELRAR